MTQIILEHRQTREGVTIELPGHLGFAEVRQAIRSHPQYKTWKFIEGRCV